MSLIKEIRDLRTQRKTVLDAAGELLTRASKRADKNLTALEETEFEARHADGDRMLKRIEQLEKQADAERQLAADAPDRRIAGREDTIDPRSRESRSARRLRAPGDTADLPLDPESIQFRAWLMGGERFLPTEQREILHGGNETRDLSAITTSEGGAVVPIGFEDNLEEALKWFGGITEAAEYMDTEAGNQLNYPEFNDTTNVGAVVAENAVVPGGTGGAAEQDPSFAVATFYSYTFTSGVVKVPRTLIQDSGIPDIDQKLIKAMSTRIARLLNTKCTIGQGRGSSEPLGLINAAVIGPTSAAGGYLAYNDLLNLLHSVDIAYRRGPKSGWMFHDQTLKAIKALVDGNGRPLFIAGGVAEGIQNREPDTLMGYPYWVNNDMPTVADNATAIAYGDFSKYVIRRVARSVMQKLVERYAETLEIGYVCASRYDGLMLNAGGNPIKLLKQQAS